MKAKLVVLAAAAALSLPACMTNVVKLGCDKDSDCQNAFCAHDVGGGAGVCVACQPKELACSDGDDQDCDGLIDCADPDCQAVDCRPSAGPCDEAERCVNGACPADGLASAGTGCRDATACGPKAACDGKSAACPGTATEGSAGKVCRDKPCAEKATCDGVSPDCPTMVPKAAGTTCGVYADKPCWSSGACDGSSEHCQGAGYVPAGTKCPGLKECEQERFCTGDSGQCPGTATPILASDSVTCREAQGPCDLAETCQGDLECPADAVVDAAAKMLCRKAEGPCDVAEACDGVGKECPKDGFAAAGTGCRAAAEGGCDLAEECTGTGPACPDDVVVGAGTVCHPTNGACDPAEECDGSLPTCPVDLLAPDTTVCRKAEPGGCDLEEKCTGTAAACPDDLVVAAETPCREPKDLCDAKEKCDGLSNACPADVVLAVNTPCRAAAGACDVVEKCDGVSMVCPADEKRPASYECKAGTDCAYPSRCDGTLTTCPAAAPRPAGTACGQPADPCGAPPACNGSGACGPPTNASAIAGTRCGLTDAETCQLTGTSTTLGCSAPGAGYAVTTTSGWIWENPLPQGNELRATVSSSGVRYFFGDAATALRYDGVGFTRLEVLSLDASGYRGTLFGACASSDGNIWVVGSHGYVGRLTPAVDGVVSPQVTGIPTTSELRGVYCEAPETIIAIDAAGSIYRWNGQLLKTEAQYGKPLRAIWGSAPDDVWAVGLYGVVEKRDATGSWTKLFCPDYVSLTSVTGSKLPAGGSEVWMTGQPPTTTTALPNVYRIDGSTGSWACEAYVDGDGRTPTGLTALSLSGPGAGWGVDERGMAHELADYQFAEGVPVGVARPLGVVDASLGAASTGPEVAVAGLSGAISIRKAVPTATGAAVRWLPSRRATFNPLNAVWAGADAMTGQHYAVGKNGTVLGKTALGAWAPVPNTVITEGDELTCVSVHNTAADMWVGGKNSLGFGFVVESVGGVPLRSDVGTKVAGVTGVAATTGWATAAAGFVYQRSRATGGTFVRQSDKPATAVTSAPQGSQVWFAGDQVWEMTGSSTGNVVPTPIAAFGSGVFVGLDATFETNLLVNLYAVATDKTEAFHYAAATGALSSPNCTLPAVPLAVRGVEQNVYWVVGKNGMAKQCNGDVTPDWAGTDLELRAVANGAGGVVVVGDQGAILRRPP